MQSASRCRLLPGSGEFFSTSVACGVRSKESGFRRKFTGKVGRSRRDRRRMGLRSSWTSCLPVIFRRKPLPHFSDTTTSVAMSRARFDCPGATARFQRSPERPGRMTGASCTLPKSVVRNLGASCATLERRAQGAKCKALVAAVCRLLTPHSTLQAPVSRNVRKAWSLVRKDRSLVRMDRSLVVRDAFWQRA